MTEQATAELTQEPTQEEQASEEKEAKEALRAGYARVMQSRQPELMRQSRDDDRREDHLPRGNQDRVEQQSDQAAADEEQRKAQQAEADEAARQEAAEKERKIQEKINAGIPKRVRDLEGSIGGLYQKIDSIAENLQKAQTQTSKEDEEDKQPAEAEALKSMREEYAELEPLLKHVEAMGAELATLKTQLSDAPQAVTREEVGAAIEESTERNNEISQISSKHGDWEQVIASNDFILFALDGGPTFQQYMSIQNMDPADQDAVLNRWSVDYADWWQQRGSAVFSPKAADAIRLIDAFKGRGADDQAARQEKERQEKRDKDAKLRAAIAPTGSGGGGPTEPSAAEAMKRGYDRVRRASAPRY